MYCGHQVAVIIPALDEEEAIGPVVGAVDRSVVDQVVVADNGSTDNTAEIAARAGALVVREDRRGYGSACLRAIEEVPDADILVFLDADGSDDPAAIEELLKAVVESKADLVIGSRVLGKAEKGALTPLQLFGNWLTCTLVRWLWGVRYSDLGPFRAIRRSSYDRLAMADPDFGWTIEMQVKAAQHDLKTTEIPVDYRVRQAGQSKVSGTLRGSFGAGKRILGYVFEAKFQELRGQTQHQPGFSAGKSLNQIMIFTRFPEPGRTKTRLIPALGEDGACELHRRLTEHVVAQARTAASSPQTQLEIHHTGGSPEIMHKWLGDDLLYRAQIRGDLGFRMEHAFDKSFASGFTSAILIGSDCPDISPEILAKSLELLRDNDLVLGPAHDGGYYLIGLRRPIPRLFRGIDWGSNRVLEQTRLISSDLALSHVELKTLSDVDRPEDLGRVASFVGDEAGTLARQSGN
jgi:rSAM/selenodomain-associated transferase 1